MGLGKKTPYKSQEIPETKGPSPKLGKQQQLLRRRTAANVPGGDPVMR